MTDNISLRLKIRKEIHKNSGKLYDIIDDCNFKWLVGEIIAGNEEYVLNHYGSDLTIGAEEILKTGFTSNQKEWILSVANALLKKDNLSTIPTPDLVRELAGRDGVEVYQIERNQQFDFSIGHRQIDYTNHMPRSKLLIVDEEGVR